MTRKKVLLLCLGLLVIVFLGAVGYEENKNNCFFKIELIKDYSQEEIVIYLLEKIVKLAEYHKK